jgi:hypothetical protein
VAAYPHAMRPDLVCVGEVLLDVTMPQLAQGAVIHAPIEVRAGGVAANAALAGVLLSSLQAGMAPAQALGAACNAAQGLIRSRY